MAHSERDFLLSLDLAAHAGLTVDPDVLFAAAFLHDMGGFPEFEKHGVDHAARSAEICDQVLIPADFPKSKIEAVREANATHSYYCKEKPQTPEAIVLHDADTLDFLGAIGVARILSLTGREAFAPNLEGAIKLLEKLRAAAPESIYSGDYAHGLAQERTQEMDAFLAALKRESADSRHL